MSPSAPSPAADPAAVRRLVDALFDHLIGDYPANQAYPGAALDETAIPPLITHFLKQTLWHEAEQAAALTSPDWFDLQHTDVQEAHDVFVEALYRHAQVPAPRWTAALHRAVEQTTNYLVQPVPTLVRFTFPDAQDMQPADTLLALLDHFSAYSYLNEAVRKELARQGVETLDRTRAAALLRRIDQDATATYDADAWLRLLAPLFTLCRRVPGLPGGVPVDALVAFFQDKGAEEVVARLYGVQHDEGTSALSQSRLHALLQEPESEPESEPEPEPEPESLAPEAPPATASFPARPVPATAAYRGKPIFPEAEEDTVTEPEPGHVPLWKQFQGGRPPLDQPRQPNPPRTAPPPPVPTPPDDARPRCMQFQQPPPAHEGSARLAHLEEAVLGNLGPRHRDVFVDALFSGSVEEYTQVLRRLQPLSTWAQASRVIARDVFQKYQVNIYSDPAVAFTDAVEARYRKK